MAALFLRAKGYKILSQRFRSGKGEIDLIALKGKTLVFVEVKARKTEEEGLYAITPRQRERIRQSAEIWLAQEEIDYDICRFDVVVLTPKGLLTHIENAFQEE